ncbi:MAG: adenylate/guanylate cyclase domain-containing protein [Bacteroidales bacterium]
MKVPLLLGQNTGTSLSLIPEISSFDIPANYNRSPNTTFCRTTDGIVFIGKQHGMLTIDQDKIFFIPTRNPVYLSRSDTDKIAYLTADDLGYVEYNGANEPVLLSRRNQIPSRIHDFYPTDIASDGSNFFLATTEGVFVMSDNTLEHFFFNRLQCHLHHTGDQLFLQVENLGLFLWSDNEFVLLFASGEIEHNVISSIVNWEDGILLFFNNSVVYKYNPEQGSLVKEIQILSAYGNMQLIRELPGGNYLMEGEDQTLSILSANDFAATPLTKLCNLPTSGFQTEFVDRFNDLWIVYNFNIFKVEYPSRSYTLDLTNLLYGTILSTTMYNGSLYLGTSEGLYRIRQGDSMNWNPEKLPVGGDGYFHLLESNKDGLIAAGSPGLIHITQDATVTLAEGDISFIKVLENSTIIVCSDSGLLSYHYRNNLWSKSILAPSMNHVTDAVEYKNGVWMLTENASVTRLDKEELTISHPGPTAGIAGNRLLVYDGKLLLMNEKGIYEWRNSAQEFTLTVIPEYIELQLRSDHIFKTTDQLWSVTSDYAGGFSLWKAGEESMPTPYFEFTSEGSFEQVVDIVEDEMHLWISGNKKLIRLDKTSGNISNKLLRVRSVEWISTENGRNYTRIRPGQEIHFKRNQVAFNLADIRYQDGPYPYYRYKLTHHQEEWSDWTKNKTIIEENLRERRYTFEAQSVSSFGIISDPVRFEFTVTPPIYRQWYAFLIYTLTILTSLFLLYKWRLLNLKHVEFRLEERINERMRSVLSEKEKSDKLVADLFPKGTAEEIMSVGRAKSKKFEMATVLFSDIQGFTKIAEEMNPEVLIDELDKFFFHFDSVVDKYNIEKIKTIGDAYMAAGGIPVKNSSNPVEVVLAGLEMQYYMKNLKKKKADIWDLRIGIHTGPVITGVVGHKKLSYDIWGDTVNTASRMESSGEPGKVNISGVTYSLVKDFFLCEYRGKLPVKYKGNIDMYFVTGLRPELSVDLHGIPNRRFFNKLQLLKLVDLEERVHELIADNHQLNLHFHKKDYIRRVNNHTELLGRSENLSEDDMLLVQTAAILLYSGLSESYENYEIKSAEIARKILPEFGFDDRQIDRISNLILSTREPFLPQNNLEAILIDAKMEYLGREDYLTLVKLLFLEMKNNLRDLSMEKFTRQQVAVLQDFNYFTVAAQRLREISPKEQVKNLESWK